MEAAPDSAIRVTTTPPEGVVVQCTKTLGLRATGFVKHFLTLPELPHDINGQVGPSSAKLVHAIIAY